MKTQIDFNVVYMSKPYSNNGSEPSTMLLMCIYNCLAARFKIVSQLLSNRHINVCRYTVIVDR